MAAVNLVEQRQHFSEYLIESAKGCASERWRAEKENSH
jgi:hypothetical protein